MSNYDSLLDDIAGAADEVTAARKVVLKGIVAATLTIVGGILLAHGAVIAGGAFAIAAAGQAILTHAEYARAMVPETADTTPAEPPKERRTHTGRRPAKKEVEAPARHQRVRHDTKKGDEYIV